MVELPQRIKKEEMTKEYALHLMSMIPNIASYLVDCVSKGGPDAHVRIQIVGVDEIRKWGMDLVIPARALGGVEHISGFNIPRASTVLENLILHPHIDGVVIATASSDEKST